MCALILNVIAAIHAGRQIFLLAGQSRCVLYPCLMQAGMEGGGASLQTPCLHGS